MWLSDRVFHAEEVPMTTNQIEMRILYEEKDSHVFASLFMRSPGDQTGGLSGRLVLRKEEWPGFMERVTAEFIREEE